MESYVWYLLSQSASREAAEDAYPVRPRQAERVSHAGALLGHMPRLRRARRPASRAASDASVAR
jgi:hypothetical protein